MTPSAHHRRSGRPEGPQTGAIKARVQNLLRHIGMYERLKSSFIYDLYWMFADKRMLEGREAEIAFYRDLLDGFRDGDLVFDIGANHGTKTDIFLRLGARVVAVDPDEANHEVLRRRFLALRFRSHPVIIVGKAVSDSEAVETMWIDAPGSAKNTLSPKWVATLRRDERRFGSRLDFAKTKEIRTVTLDQLIRKYGAPRGGP